MSLRRFVFNPPTASLFTDSAVTRYLASNEPSIILEEIDDPEHLQRRHGAQLEALAGLDLTSTSAPSDLFEDDLALAFRQYRLRRLWVDDAHEREDPDDPGLPPVGDAPPRALAAGPLAAARLEALLAQQGAAGLADERLYLFSPIVALEWRPTRERLRRLQWAFRRASDYLYDVTNGCMAFGQVIIADAAWMRCADIQILASNRYLPRSWVGGLYEPHKYTPIRLGRGLWVRDRRIVVDWDEPEGYRAIVHEWAHYALGMKDGYMRGRIVYENSPKQLGEQASSPGSPAHKVVLPDRRVKSDSIMASPQGNSELGNPLPLASDNIRKVISQRYPALEGRLQRPWSGPGQLPLPLPHFRFAGSLAAKDYSHNERSIFIPFAPQAMAGDPERGPAPYVTLDNDKIPTGRREVFILSYDEHGALRGVSAQGELDARSPEQGFTLLGASPGDRALMLDWSGPHLQTWSRALDRDDDETLIESQRAKLEELFATLDKGQPADDPELLTSLSALHGASGWRRASAEPTPPGQTLAVIPLNPDDNRKNSALVQLSGASAGAAVFGVDGLLATPGASPASFALPSLDGFVVDTGADSAERSSPHLPVCYDFSQGGPPASAPVMVSDPIAAGAASGEALLLCDVTGTTVSTADYRVITTTSRNTQLPPELEALSPTYTLASNHPLHESFTPTLLIVNVQSDRLDGRDVRICLLTGDATFKALPTYLAPSAAYGAAPLRADDVPALFPSAVEPAAGDEVLYMARFVLARVGEAPADSGAGATAA